MHGSLVVNQNLFHAVPRRSTALMFGVISDGNGMGKHPSLSIAFTCSRCRLARLVGSGVDPNFPRIAIHADIGFVSGTIILVRGRIVVALSQVVSRLQRVLSNTDNSAQSGIVWMLTDG